MKYLIFLIFLVVIAHADDSSEEQSDEDSSEEQRSRRMMVRGTPVSIEGTSSSNNIGCSEFDHDDMCADCQTLRVCYRESTSLEFTPVKHTCKHLNPYKPYCENNKCIASSEVCENTPKEVMCYGDGYLPDPTDCTRYMHCINKVGTMMQCPVGYTYDHRRYGDGSCTLGNTCFEFSENHLCFGKMFETATYPPDLSIYALCLPKYFGGPDVDKCRDGYKFDEDSNTCVPWCQYEQQKIRAYEHCTKYYVCYKDGGVFKTRIAFCPAGSNAIQRGDNAYCWNYYNCEY